MIGCCGARYIVDALSSGRLPRSATNDDLLAAAEATQERKLREPWLTRRIADWIWGQGHHAPETLDAALARLGAISTHLLDDIGCEVLSKRRTGTTGAEPAHVVVVRLIDPVEPRAPRAAQGPVYSPAIAAE